MRNSKALIEYRCQCGKLLCKGFLPIGIVEIKCKRCARLSTFGILNRKGAYLPLIAVDSHDLITGSPNIETMLGYSLPDLVGKPVETICPLLADGAERTKLDTALKEDGLYEIKRNVFLLRDGSQLPLESLLLGICKGGLTIGYCIFIRT